MKHYIVRELFFRYVDYYRLELPSDDIEFVLTATAKRIGALMKGNNFSKGMHYYMIIIMSCIRHLMHCCIIII